MKRLAESPVLGQLESIGHQGDYFEQPHIAVRKLGTTFLKATVTVWFHSKPNVVAHLEGDLLSVLVHSHGGALIHLPDALLCSLKLLHHVLSHGCY